MRWCDVMNGVDVAWAQSIFLLTVKEKQQGRGKIEEKIGARTDWQRADMDTLSKVHNAEKPTR